MDWLPLASVALGGVVGAGSTLLSDRLKWLRDREAQRGQLAQDLQDRERAGRRLVYSEYLAALARVRNGLREVAHASAMSREERTLRLRDVFPDSGAYELRFQIQLASPASLIVCSERAVCGACVYA